MVTDNSAAATTSDAAASNGGGVSSPQSLRRSLPSAAWASVVRGDTEQNSSPTAAAASAAPGSYSSSPPAEQVSTTDESSGLEAQPENSDANGDSNAGRPRRPAWNRPLNGVVEPVSVMGGDVSWPALSETTRPVPRSSSDTPRPASDGLVNSLQAPIISQPPQRPANNNVHANSAGNNTMPSRARSRNRGGGSGGGGSSTGSGPSQNSHSSQNAFNQPPPLSMPPPFPVFEVPYTMVPPVLDTSLRGARPVGGAQSHPGNDHSSQRNNSRRGNHGPRPRGDGTYHNNHGGRRDQDRRDVHHPPPYMTPPVGYMPPPLPPGVGPFMAPPPVRLFPAPMGFDMAPPYMYVPAMPPEAFRMPVAPPLPPMLFPPANENTLTSRIVKQIDFYFSDDNLVKDSYLKSRMDDHGWVPITLIASFRRVEQLTHDIPLILESLRSSTVVEVQGDKVRRRNEWNKWVNSYSRPNPDSGPHPSTSTSRPENKLATSLAAVSLNDCENGNTNARQGHVEMATGSQEFTGQSELTNREEGTAEDHPNSV